MRLRAAQPVPAARRGLGREEDSTTRAGPPLWWTRRPRSKGMTRRPVTTTWPALLLRFDQCRPRRPQHQRERVLIGVHPGPSSRQCGYSAFAPDVITTLAHFSV